MTTICRQGASILLALLCLSACSDNDANYPNEYIGFNEGRKEYTVDKTKDEQEISVKVIAAGKKDSDREATLTYRAIPGKGVPYKLLDKQVVIPAKKKSATVRICIYPKQIKKNEEIHLVCMPKDKDVKQTLLTIKLVTK